MMTAVDTNVIVALWDSDSSLNRLGKAALDTAAMQGSIVISAPVYAELLAAPGRDERFLAGFLADTAITVDWLLGEPVWRLAGRAFQARATRRRSRREPGPRRILADFLIGAHARHINARLLTLDDRFYRSCFPGLTVVQPGRTD